MSVEQVRCVHTEILRTATERQFAVPAGVYMPDHVHLLVRGLSAQSEFKSFMKVLRQRSAHAFRRAFGERLWQDGYFDRVIRDVDDERERIRYIVHNPTDARLCENPHEFGFSWWPGRPMPLTDVRSAEL